MFVLRMTPKEYNKIAALGVPGEVRYRVRLGVPCVLYFDRATFKTRLQPVYLSEDDPERCKALRGVCGESYRCLLTAYHGESCRFV